ncbi:HipA domain-containing protein [Aneurinibacillus tyrosinisolvens]|uniref:HipA domain-containing protein n=1 Tax=Aneurinibacillus tyrosinisolvens TaxID=1443435 RepID=UPI00063FC110|nr:HipA domain-containing protein [Aneurinibacillus tyrosinisolvens]
MSNYDIIDVSQWERDVNTGKGTKEKRMLVQPHSRRLVMFKEPAEGSGDVWSEKIASEIGKACGFNVHEVEIGVANGVYGALAYWFLGRGDELLEGVDLIKEEGHEFDEWKRTGYNLQLIQGVLTNHIEDPVEKFLEIVVFDALIGNTDRHSQNWGVVKLADGTKVLAPAYDNSSSLGREFNSNLNKVTARLKDKNLFVEYCHAKKGSYLIGWNEQQRIPHLDYIKLLHEVYPEVVKKHVDRLIVLKPSTIKTIIEKIPNEVMSDTLKEFVNKFLNYRVDYILKLINRSNYGTE